MQPDAITTAWLAGLFEGEGNMYIAPSGNVTLTITMTDRDIIERLYTIYPGQKIHVIQPKRTSANGEKSKIAYVWRVGKSEQVREILNLLLPHFGNRRSIMARKILEHLDTRPGMGHLANKTHCDNDHEFTPENTYIRKGTTYRQCRECRRVASRKYLARKRNLRG